MQIAMVTVKVAAIVRKLRPTESGGEKMSEEVDTFEVIRNSDNKKFTVYDIVRTQHYTYFMIYDGGWKYIDADLFRECDKN